MTLHIDLNCDMGESFGAWKMGQDEQILPYVSSANIACGYHAGDASVMRHTVAQAIKHGVKLGAHPGLPDLVGFGRRNMAISPENAYDIMVVQIGALAAVAATQGTRLHHVKAHGALYNMAVKDATLAKALAQAISDVDKSLIMFVLAGSCMVEAAQQCGLTVKQEVFCDRTYQPDGSLTPRREHNAMITDVNQSITQVLQMVQQGVVTAVDGSKVTLKAETLCIHGDQPNAVIFAQSIRSALQDAGINIS
jgi:5-oxoprolinase (ATP-hydrolysing) subunit A